MVYDMDPSEPPPPYELVESSSPIAQDPASERTLVQLALSGSSPLDSTNISTPLHSFQPPMISRASPLGTPSAPPLSTLASNLAITTLCTTTRECQVSQQASENLYIDTDDGSLSGYSTTASASLTMVPSKRALSAKRGTCTSARDEVSDEAIHQPTGASLHTSNNSTTLHPSDRSLLNSPKARQARASGLTTTSPPTRLATLPCRSTSSLSRQHQRRRATVSPGLSSSDLSTRSSWVGDALDPVPLSQSVVPAPPPRLLQFQSRAPSSVPACPFPLCQKPIALTQTRLERGVTVWLVCTTLFLLNTYWTTHALLSHFAPPDQLRLHPPSSGSILLEMGRGFLALLGLQGSTPVASSTAAMTPIQSSHPRPYSALPLSDNRHTVASVGFLQDHEPSLLQLFVRFSFSATLAIIRWWLCLVPLLIRPLFDTVHSCPHPHPYPYSISLPEQASHDGRILVDEQASSVAVDTEDPSSSSVGVSSSSALSPVQTTLSSMKQRKEHQDEDDKDFIEEKRLTENYYRHGWTPKHLASAPPVAEMPEGSASEPIGELHCAQEDPGQGIEQLSQPVAPIASLPDPRTMSRRGWFKFWRQQQAQQQSNTNHVTSRSDSTTRTDDDRVENHSAHKAKGPSLRRRMRERRLAWRERRAQLQKLREREQVIRQSQDIGRYSLLYALGSFLQLGTAWKQAVLQPGRIVADVD